MTLSFAREPWTDPLWAHAERSAEASLRELPEAVILAFDADLCLVRAGGQALERLGDPASCAPGSPLEHVLPGDLWLTIEPLLRSALAGETRSREIWTGAQRHCVLVDVGPLREHGAQGAVTGGLLVVLEITARRQAELLEPHLNSDFDGEYERLEHTPIGAGVLELDGGWLLVNRALCEITGYTAEELIGRPFEEIVHPDDADNDSEQRRALLAGEIPAFRVDKRLLDAAGEAGSTILSLSLVREHDGTPLHYVAQLQDVSERRRLEYNLRALGDHDPLTGVRNRRLFGHDLKLQVARSRRYGEVAGLMLIELDAFARFTEYHGEQAADEALEAVARALSRRLRETDLLARVGAEQFAVLLPHIDLPGLAVLAEGLDRVISACGVDVGDELLHPSAGIGFTLVDEHALTAEQALLAADRAMRDARQAEVGAGG
ncbi:MAG TPA: diguanylate cyclase [Solirubrobacteraceae bacterium]|nr:diguanylate cyclase [Solirubrobacteraceae bacterium]